MNRCRVTKTVLAAIAIALVATSAVMAYAPRVYYGAKYEPKFTVIHGAGSSEPSMVSDGLLSLTDYADVLGTGKHPITVEYFANIGAPWQLSTLKSGILDLWSTQEGTFAMPQIGIDSYMPTDEVIDAAAAAILQLGCPVFIRLNYEFNAPNRSWAGNPTQFKADWQRVVTRFRALDVPAAFVWCAYTGHAGSSWANLQPYYPGDEFVDWWGVDLYSPSDMTNSDTTAFLDQAELYRKPVMIGEAGPKWTPNQLNSLGAQGGADSWNGWFVPYFDLIKNRPGIKAHTYKNWDMVYWSLYLGNDWMDWGDFRLGPNSPGIYGPPTSPEYVRDRYVTEMSSALFEHAAEVAPSWVLNAPSGPIGSAEFWFAASGDPTGTPITTINAAQGSDLTVSVWYQRSTAWDNNAVELLVGYDVASSRGQTASAIDGKITATAPAASNISATYPIVLANNLGGGNGSGTRPYGVHLAAGTALKTNATGSAPVKLCDVTLRNASIAVGGNYNVTLWNDSSTNTGWTSFSAKSPSSLIDHTAAVLSVHSTASVEPPASALTDAKKAADGTRVNVTAYVSAKFGTYFYLEVQDRSNGIRVDAADSGLSVGQKAKVVGTLQTLASGERSIGSATVTPVAGTFTILPLAMNNKTLGGAGFFYVAGPPKAGQQGVASGIGTNNIGLFVKAWGTISRSGGDTFVSDGSGVSVKVIGLPGDVSGYRAITGVSSCWNDGTSLQRQIVAVSWN